MDAVPTLRQLVRSFTEGAVSCEEATAAALEKAAAAEGVFIRIDDGALQQAARIDRARRDGEPLPALAGAAVTLKDLFNIQGQRTLAGSVALRDEAEVEKADAVVVGHLRAAGVLFLGRVNMSEFAFSGMGLNPHYGTPMCIWDRATGRLPGGSSSGSAVSVAEGIVPASVGSDTAGSCRVPAAFNGVVGAKPTYGRLSLRGVYPLSPSSDAPGPLANDVDGCFILDHVMAGRLKHGELLPVPARRAADGVRLVVPEAGSVVLAGLDDEVAAGFARALEWLEAAGVTITRAPLPALDGCAEMFTQRAVAVFEAWDAHRERLERCGDVYDPFVRRRMQNGRRFDAEARREIYREKAALVAAFGLQMGETGADALVYPTVQCVPPAIAETEDFERMPEVNFRCLRNTATVNYFDGCAISLPCHAPGDAPVGLMLCAGNGADRALYEIAGAVEEVLNRGRGW